MLPTNTRVTIETKTRLNIGVEAVAVMVTEGSTDPGPGAALLAEDERLAVERLLGSGVSRGKAREVHFDILQSPSRERPQTSDYRRVLVAGLGPMEKLTLESFRRSGAALARACRKQRLGDIAICLPVFDSFQPAALAEAIVTGFLLASFHYREYKGTASNAADSESPDVSLTLVSSAEHGAQVRRGVERGRIIADSQNFARTIASRPGNVINPPSLAQIARKMAGETGLGFRVLDEKEMARLGMGGILAVGAASRTPPRMIVLEHKPAGSNSRAARGAKTSGNSKRSARPLLAVGKAITFDTGGISIKSADKMGRMIFDKCGGMAVLGFMCAVARLKLPIHVVGILSSAENTLSGDAYRPGDIIKLYNGVTVEVTNTDAEGRLVLGDALAWGIETFKPAAVVDLATLTGGVIVALGSTMAGVMANNDELVDELSQVSRQTGENFWRLPLNDDLRDYIKSQHADIVNAGGREGHPVQGGAFLSHFVPRDDSVPWAHLDIAGVADTDKELPLYEKGATGWGVRTLVEWATRRAGGANE